MVGTKQFDVDEALERALEAFWEEGYRGLSMTQLLERMDIRKGSFYATFKSKRDIFLQALGRYIDERLERFEADAVARPAREALEAQFEAILGECRSRTGHRGCMALNSALEVAPHDPEVATMVKRALERHERLFADLVTRAQKEGSVSELVDAGRAAKALMAFVLSMRIYSRAGVSRTTVAEFASLALEAIDRPGV